MRSALFAGVAFVAALFVGVAFADDPQSNPLLQGLEKVEGANADLFYVRPGTAWQKYRTVQMLPLVLPATRNENFTDADAATLRQVYADAVRGEMQKEQFAVVDAPRRDTLVLAANAYQVISDSISIKLLLRDGLSQTIVGAGSDLRFANLLTRDDSKITKLEQARNAFRIWGKLLAQDLKERGANADVNPEECFKWGKDCH